MTDKPHVTPSKAGRELDVVVQRLAATGHRSAELQSRLEALSARVETLPAQSVLQTENDRVRRPRYLLSGWACRFRPLHDGRRQIFDFVLPGEGVGVCPRTQPIANTSTMALTPVRLADAAPLLTEDALAQGGELRRALQAQADLDERRLLDQVVRLGRMSALERVAHLLLDLRERMDVIGQVTGDRFAFPITQETLADFAGLSVVHVNRTLQELRRQGMADVSRTSAHLPDVAALAVAVGFEYRRPR